MRHSFDYSPLILQRIEVYCIYANCFGVGGREPGGHWGQVATPAKFYAGGQCPHKIIQPQTHGSVTFA